MGSVDYTIERKSGSADFKYKSPDDSACVKFYDTIKKQENCMFAQLFFGVGSTKRYVGETVYKKHLNRPIMPEPEPERKIETATEKTDRVRAQRINKIRNAFVKSDSFTRWQAECVLCLQRNSTRIVLQFMCNCGMIEKTDGDGYRFVKQV
jgi:hypothetical protein